MDIHNMRQFYATMFDPAYRIQRLMVDKDDFYIHDWIAVTGGHHDLSKSSMVDARYGMDRSNLYPPTPPEE